MSKLFAVCKTQLTALTLACIFLAVPSAFAEVPTSMTQQGRLLTPDGQPMKGNKTLLFELYNAPTDGELLWSDQFEVNLGETGFYTAMLGSTNNPLDHTVLQGGPTFMQLVIDDKPLLPRLELTSVPYAQIAQMAHQAKLADSAIIADSVKPGSINTAAIADKAVTADKIDSIPWGKITGQPTIPTYTGANFVTSNQNCTTAGQMVTGISASGQLICAAPVDNDTKYTAGNGLTLTGTSFSIGSGAITNQNIVDMSWTKITGAPAITGRAVSSFVGSGQNCTGANVIQGFKADGTLNCITPPDTKYTAGGGLNLSGTGFSIAPNGVTDTNIVGVGWAKVTGKPEITTFASSDFVKSGTACTGTSFFMGFNANGTLRCGQPTDTTYTVQPGQGLSITGNQFGVTTSGIQSGHIADGAITSSKIANPITIYEISSPACDNQGSLTKLSSCANVKPCTRICGGGTVGSPFVPYTQCNGNCGCINPILIIEPNVCPNTSLGHIIP